MVEPSRRELDNWLWDEQGWDILFFAGHSCSQADITTGQIYINEVDTLTIPQLKNALKKAIRRGLKIAIFNSCDGLGIASELADLHIPQIIVMREPVPDLVAQEFLKYFIQAFSRGESLYLAVREAQERLQFLEDKFPYATWLPVIFHNPSEPQLTWQDLCKIDLKANQQDLQQDIYITKNQPQNIDIPRMFGHENIVYGRDEFPVECIINKSKLRIEYCDITRLTVDVMVSSDDIRLSMGGGVSRAILRAGGESIWQEAQARIPVKLGDIAITTAGRIRAKQIFHAAVIDYSRRYLTNIDLIQEVTRKCLKVSDSLGFRSIAFPALATGAARLSPEESAIAMITEIGYHLSSATNIETVILALYTRSDLPSNVISRFHERVMEFLIRFRE